MFKIVHCNIILHVLKHSDTQRLIISLWLKLLVKIYDILLKSLTQFLIIVIPVFKITRTL